MKTRLFLITDCYPNTGGDSIFVLPELKELKKKFDVSVVCTCGKVNLGELEKEVQYYYYQPCFTILKKLKYICKYPFYHKCRSEMADIFGKDRKNCLGKLRKSIEFFACGEEFFSFFRKNIVGKGEKQKAVFYTFWCNAYSLPMIIHRKYYPQFCLVTRLHRYDLYNESYMYGRQPFKKVINDGLDKLFFVAELSKKYYLDTYPQMDPEKAEVIRLGVPKVIRELQKEKNHTFLLVSCSGIISRKRVDLIVQALAALEEPVRWIHFGDGESMQDVVQLAQKLLNAKTNIQYEYKGYVENQQIRRFYENNYVDCFITAAESEGSPVSIMEALAAGIPIIGTAVGDIPLMIDGNGILLHNNPEPEEVSLAIKKIYHMSEASIGEMRKRSYELWKQNYDTECNSGKLGERINEVFKEHAGGGK